ncbi:bacteriohemerythrin [Fusibacter sp. JL298sf-3]
MIEWSSHYELGIESIDNQHKELVRITGRLSDLLGSATQGEDIYDDMVTIVGDIKAYTVEHFSYEEMLFDKFGYEDKERHKQEHKKLIDEIETLDLRALDDDQVAHGKKILNYLITWVFKHISGSDFLYKDLFKSHGL